MKAIEYIGAHREDEDDCECIILPDGTVEDAKPSHIRKLGEIAKQDTLTFNEWMEKDMEPLFWMVEYTGCISVWKKRVLVPLQMTKAQEMTLQMLGDATFLSLHYLLQRVEEKYGESVREARRLMDGEGGKNT